MIQAEHRFIALAIAGDELRRELERAGRTTVLAALDAWNGAAPVPYLLHVYRLQHWSQVKENGNVSRGWGKSIARTLKG